MFDNLGSGGESTPPARGRSTKTVHEHHFLSETALRPGQTVTLPPGESHHVAHVLRLGVGDTVTLFDGRGAVAAARICAIGPPDARGSESSDSRARRVGRVAVEAMVETVRAVDPPRPAVHLWVPWLHERSRLDWLIEKAAELGVEQLTVCAPAAGGGAKRLDRWRHVAMAAAKQSGAAWLMKIGAVPDLVVAPPPAADLSVLLSEKPAVAPLRSLLSSGALGHVAIAVGPPRGFGDQEKEMIRLGWQRASLGPRRLRSETAALVAVALIRGRFDPPGE